MREDTFNTIIITSIWFIIIGAILGIIYFVGYLILDVYPNYNVWASGKAGQAQLAQADYNRKIAVREAMAKSASAVELAKAEVIRAGGVAKANKIIGESLKQNEAYLTYLWLQNLESKYNKTIYIPTEANLPMLEAGRLNTQK